MSIGTGKRTRRLTDKQVTCIRLIRDKMAAGRDFGPQLLAEVHDEAYGLDGDAKMASTYAGQNMKRAQFLAALNLDAAESQETLKSVLWGWLLNFGTSPDLAKTAAKLLARSALAEKVHVTFDEGEFSNKTTEQLEFYGAFHRWPSKDEELYFEQHQEWPKLLDGGRPN